MSDCGCSSHAHRLMPIEEAQAFLLSRAKPIAETEDALLEQALDRVCAGTVASRIDVPGWDNSAMDGYAVHGADLAAPGTRLRVAQRIPAGSTGVALERGTAARIFTGAPIPPGADTVVIQEVCDADGDQVTIREIPKPGANVRRAGEDIREGQPILQPGIRLQPAHLGLAASVGIERIPVYRRLRVALFSSGDELVMPGLPLGPGQIYNSNRFTLTGMLQRLGCEVIQLGQVVDTLEATCDALARGAEQADLVLASGGVSVGEEDHVKPAVEKMGSLELWKIAIRPGKPLAFGHIGNTPFIGTPGNPVSLFVTFCVFARPFILKCQGVGEEGLFPTPLTVAADFDAPKADKRREYMRARLAPDGEGRLWATPYPSRSSAVLSSVAWANGLAVIPEQQTLSRGDPVQFLSFHELLA